jgi:hypothetical protein
VRVRVRNDGHGAYTEHRVRMSQSWFEPYVIVTVGHSDPPVYAPLNLKISDRALIPFPSDPCTA